MAKRGGKTGGGTPPPNTVPDDVISKLAEKQKEAMEALRKEMQDFSEQSSKSFEIAAAAAALFGDKLGSAAEKSETSSQSLDGLTNSLKKMGKAQDDAAKSAGFKKKGSGQDGQSSIFAQVDQSSKKAKVSVTAFSVAVQGLGKAFKALTSFVGGAFDVIKSVFSFITDVAMGIWDFFKGIYEGLFEMAQEQRKYATENRRAAEEIRENFGDISKGTGKAVLDFGRTLASASIAGLGAMQVFENAAEAIRFANEVASAAPAAFDKLQDQFKGQRGANIVGFAKGLGISTEQLGGLMRTAIATGRTVEGLGTEMTKYSKGLSSRFGVDSKLISKSMTKAMLDVKHFANATVKEIGQAAVYAHKLGVELSDITGILDAFDTFDQAAENVSKLSQAFGVNIDTMELVSAKTPADALAKVKAALDAAGKSADQMNRQELKLLASTVGMDEATVRQTLSNQNQGTSLENIKEAGNSVEKQMMSTGQALKEVSQDIKQVVRELQTSSKGFFETFLDGFLEGVATSSDMRKVLGNLQQAIEAVFAAGRRLGIIFVETFPGVKKMLDALASFFNPSAVGGMFNGFTDVFGKFFKKLQSGTGDVKNLFSDLWEEIKQYFTKQGPAGSEFLQGITEFWNAIKQIAATAIIAIGDLIADAFTAIADAIENGVDTSGAKSAAGKLLAGAKKEFSPIGDAFMQAFVKIKEPFLRLMSDLGNSAMGFIEKRVETFFKERLPVLIENFLVDIPNLISKIITHFSQKLAASFSSNPFYQVLISGALEGALKSIVLAPLAAFKFIKGTYDFILAGWEKIKVGVGWIAEKFNVIQNSSVFKTFISPLKGMLKIVEIISEKISKIKPPEALIKALSVAGKLGNFAGKLGNLAMNPLGAALEYGMPPAVPGATSEAISQVGTASGEIKRSVQSEQFVGPIQDSEPVISEQEKMGAEMLKKTSDEMGLTTVDNVEERLKKIKEIGAKISGGKAEFEKSMNTIREDLKTMNFSLFDNAADAAKFSEGLGGLQQVLTFTNTIKSLVVSFQGASTALAGLGDSTVKGSIVSNFIDTMASFTNGMSDVFILFKGGTMSDGTKLENGIKISDASLASTAAFSGQISQVLKTFDSIKSSFEAFKTSLNEIAKIDFTDISKKISEKAKTGTLNLIADLAPLASLMGSVDGEISLAEMFANPDNLESTTTNIVNWCGEVYDLIAGTISTFDSSLIPQAEELAKKVIEFNTKIKESLDQGISKEIKIAVGEVGGEIKVKNPTIDMQVSPNITLKLSVNVSMDARELEKVLVTKNDSIVVTTFNAMSKAGPGAVATGIQNRSIQVTKDGAT